MVLRRHQRFDDVGNLKGRIAEAFVEAIFRRAGYAVSRVGRESQVQRLVKIGGDEFLPDFLVRKEVRRDETGRPLHRLLPLEVKFRRDVQGYLETWGRELITKMSVQWPDVVVVFVTDHPEAGRSCFQVIDVSMGKRSGLQDLHAVKDLDIYEGTVREYEMLVRQMFLLVEQSELGAPERVRGGRPLI